MSSKTTDHFSQIFSITLPANITEDESREKDDEIRKKLLHQKKYLPVAKAEDELFDANLHVNAGPEFARNYGAQNDGNIIVTIDNKKVKNPPFPSNFQECNFTKELLANIQRKRYMDPTQVQKAMILLIQKTKNDIIGNAQTGSGKTGAVLLPIIDEIHKDYIKGVAQFNSDSPYAIIIASTRELVAQMYEECLSFSIDTQIKTAVAYGDTPMEYSIRELHKGCDVFCTTIGRLCHYVREQIIYLHNVRYFIIDEADLFLNGQRPERFENLQYIKSQLPQNHRTFMISATFGERAELAAKEFLKAKYFFVRIPQTISTISHKFIKVEHYNKKDLLIKLLKERSTLNETDGLFDTEKTIVFKSGKREADRLGIALCYHGFRAIVIHKNKAQQLRFESVDNFTKGKYHIIVSSDNIIARGLNLPNVEHVINFDLPKTEDYNQYIHRVGRTGRAGNFGRATSFFDPTNVNDIQTAPFYAKILEDLNQPVPDFFNPIIKLQQQIREAHQNAREQVNGVQSQSNTNLASGSAELQDDENIFS